MAKQGSTNRFEALWPGMVQPEVHPRPLHARHYRSERLRTDGRVAQAPRFHQIIAQNNTHVASIRVYLGPTGTKGGELLTIALLAKKDGYEHECRFDELYPIWVTFKKEDDATRAEKAKTQFDRTGGIEAFVKALAGRR